MDDTSIGPADIIYFIQWSVVKVGIEILFSYTCIIWLFPKFLIREMYVSFTLFFLLSALGSIILAAYVLKFSFETFASVSFSELFWLVTYQFIMSSSLPVCILILAFKLLKIWHQKGEEKNILVLKNTEAELQILKAQIHPHFLFNTLNNIYSYALESSAIACQLIEKLSRIFTYMNSECNRPLVSLSEEIDILHDYIGLERVRYGNRLNLQIRINGCADNLLIAPLLMIPFVENSFKHGSSKMLIDPRIDLHIEIKKNHLTFEITNNKPPSTYATGESTEVKGIGLINTTKRLKLLYPHRHDLVIESSETNYHVKLHVALEHITPTRQISAPFQNGFDYAITT